MRLGTGRGGAKEEIRAGHCIVCVRREALAQRTATTAMNHIAIAEALDGRLVDWLEHVSDEHYRR
jgi:hypothetical protein